MAHVNDDPDLKFNRFLDLPIELQIGIWKYALPGSQLITIKSLPRNPHDSENTRPQCVTTGYKVPPLLHACRYSRLVALQVYRLSLPKRLLHPVYVNPHLDKVMLIGWEAVDSFSNPPDFRGREYVISNISKPFSMFLHLEKADLESTVWARYPFTFRFCAVSPEGGEFDI